jgi:hypothetical protein
MRAVKEAGDVVIIGELPAAGAAPGAAEDIVDESQVVAAGPRLPKGAVRNADGTVTLTLQFPVEQQSKRASDAAPTTTQYDTLTMRRLKGRDLTRIAEARNGTGGMVGVALSAGIPEILFARLWDKMDAVDITAAAEVLQYFLGNGAKAGG